MEVNRFYNLEAELNIIGAVFRDNNALCIIIDFLDSDDFYSTRYKLIYNASVKLYEDGKPIDVVALCDKLGTSLQEVGGISYLGELYGSSLPSSRVEFYGEIVKEKANLRRMMTLLEGQKRDREGKDKSCDEIVDSLENAFLKLKRKNNLQDGNAQQDLMQVIDMLEKRYQNGGEIQGISTGYRVIDKMLGGLNKEDFIIIAARPSMGKTAMALNLALNTALREEAEVAFFNLEVGKNNKSIK